MQRIDPDYTLGVWNLSTIAYVNFTETDVYAQQISSRNYHKSRV